MQGGTKQSNNKAGDVQELLWNASTIRKNLLKKCQSLIQQIAFYSQLECC